VSYGCCVSLYLVRQLGVALVEFVQWRIDFDTQHSLDLRDLFLLIDCTNASYLSVDELSRLSLVWSSGQSNAGSNTLSLYYLLLSKIACSVDLSVAIDCEAFASPLDR